MVKDKLPQRPELIHMFKGFKNFLRVLQWAIALPAAPAIVYALGRTRLLVDVSAIAFVVSLIAAIIAVPGWLQLKIPGRFALSAFISFALSTIGVVATDGGNTPVSFLKAILLAAGMLYASLAGEFAVKVVRRLTQKIRPLARRWREKRVAAAKAAEESRRAEERVGQEKFLASVAELLGDRKRAETFLETLTKLDRELPNKDEWTLDHLREDVAEYNRLVRLQGSDNPVTRQMATEKLAEFKKAAVDLWEVANDRALKAIRAHQTERAMYEVGEYGQPRIAGLTSYIENYLDRIERRPKGVLPAHSPEENDAPISIEMRLRQRNWT